LSSFSSGKCQKGINPFDQIRLNNGERLSAYVKCNDPNSMVTYSEIKRNIENLIEQAISSRG